MRKLALGMALAMLVMAAQTISGQTLKLQIYNKAELQEGIVDEVAYRAAKILDRMGIEAVALNCGDPKEETRVLGCDQFPGPNALVLTLLKRDNGGMGDASGRGRRLGYAVLTRDQGYANSAGIFVQEVREISPPDMFVDVLAHVAVHEAGHVLLRTNEHAGKGLMKAHWGKDELKLISTNQFDFSEKQVKRLNRELQGDRARFVAAVTGRGGVSQDGIVAALDETPGSEPCGAANEICTAPHVP